MDVVRDRWVEQGCDQQAIGHVRVPHVLSCNIAKSRRSIYVVKGST